MSKEAKKKAIEIRDLFYNEVPSRVMHYDYHCALAKRCALIHVKGIMKDADENWSVDHYNYEHSNHYKHWLEVKQELEKL